MRSAVSREKGSTDLLAEILEDAVALLVVGLCVAGIAGLGYKLLGSNGWVSSLLQALWKQSGWLIWFAAFAIAGVTLLVKHNYDRLPQNSRAANFIVYLFMAFGLFFIFKLIWTGAL